MTKAASPLAAPLNIADLATASLGTARPAVLEIARALRETAPRGELPFNMAAAPGAHTIELRVSALSRRGGWRAMHLQVCGGSVELALHERERTLALLGGQPEPLSGRATELQWRLHHDARRFDREAAARALPALHLAARTLGYTLLINTGPRATTSGLPGGCWLRLERELYSAGRTPESLLAEHAIKEATCQAVSPSLALCVPGAVASANSGEWLRRAALSDAIQFMDPGLIASVMDPHDVSELYG